MGKLFDGYVYFYIGKRNWKASPDERWVHEVYTVDGHEKFVGYRAIDGVRVGVWKTIGDYFIAQRRLG